MPIDGQESKYRLQRFNPWLLAVFFVIAGTLIAYYTGMDKSSGGNPSPAVPPEPLQLGQLQPHVYDDMGFSIYYPSGWTDLEFDERNPVTIKSKERCLGLPLVTSFWAPDTLDSIEFQSLIDKLTSLSIQLADFILVEKQSITYNGVSFVIVILNDTSIFDNEMWVVYIYILSEDEYMYSTIAAYCTPDCWEYYEEAVYTIASTYQFID